MATAIPRSRGPSRLRRFPPPAWLALAVCGLAPSPIYSQIQSLPAPPTGYVEAGVPDFVVLGPEAFGLSSAPVDFVRLPDGRFVAAALRQLAIGDGTRWDVFDEISTDTGGDLQSLMVDDQGRMYATTGEAVGLINIDDNGHWGRQVVKSFPTVLENRHPNLAFAKRLFADWYWFGASGCITRWETGDALRYLGSVNNVSSLFSAAGKVYVSDASNGRLFRLDGDSLTHVLAGATDSPDFAVTGAAPYTDGRTLLATVNRGLLLFDGTSLLAPPRPDLLAGGRHINDVCALADGLFAAAVENFGLVFFDRTGRIVQTLDRSSDHRLARIRKLVPGAPGELWALLNAGVARIVVPSPVSHIEALVENGFTFALPVRHLGRLWLCADGVALRGEYDSRDRLLRFVPDSPAGRYVYQLFPDLDTGTMLASTDAGILLYRDGMWGPGIAAPKGMHIFARGYGGSRWFYSAPGQIGWIRREPSGAYVLDPVAVPELGDSFGGVCDRDDVAWIELGAGRCGRVDLRAPHLKFENFGPEQGLGDSWVQLFLYHGEAHVVVSGRVMRFVREKGQFVYDDAFDLRFPDLSPNIVGRPIHDSRGRFWVMARSAVQVFDDTTTPPLRLDLPNLYGLRPYYSVAQDDGVIWMHRNNFLVRYDPAVPFVPPPPLHAMIGRVQLLADNRTLFPHNDSIDPVPYASNTISVHFIAIGSPLGASVTFDTLLEGASKDWVAAGAGGSAVFNRLKEGRYVLHVRPRLGDAIGNESMLAFVVNPPWFRSPPAYVSYGVGAVGLIAFIAWLGAYLEKREKRRLARIVAERTAELHDSNRLLAIQVAETTSKALQLQSSEERYRHLNEELENRVADRTAALAASNHELEAFSYSVSHDLRAPLRNISGFAELLHKRLCNQLAAEHAHYLDVISTEAIRLGRLIDSLLAFSRLSRAALRCKPCDLAQIVDAVRAELQPSLSGREIEWRIGPLPAIEGDATLLRQIFANLLGNAVKFTRNRRPAIIEIGELPAANERLAEHVFFVRDNGAGFDPQYSDKLFGVFQRLHRASEFEGTGIGLANVRRIVARHGGRVWAEGRPDVGATFFVALPNRPPEQHG